MLTYFTFGSDDRYPYGREDYVMVKSDTREQAYALFRAMHPDRPGSSCLNCAGVYTEAEFESIGREYYPNRCPVETIAVNYTPGPVDPKPTRMTVRELLGMEIDIDVIDDVCEELYICFCGPMKLTPEGAERFSDVLDYPVSMLNYTDCSYAVVHIDDPDDHVWQEKLHKAKEFFEADAGYCSDSDYDKWFCED